MVRYRVGAAARLLGVSVDTARRLAGAGRPDTARSPGGRRLVGGDQGYAPGSPVRNHLRGIATQIGNDRVGAQVELRCGVFGIVSLATRESVDAMRLEPGMLATAVVKAANEVIERAATSNGAEQRVD